MPATMREPDVQTTRNRCRMLQIRSTTGEKAWTNVELAHNSLVALHGSTFQSRYTHQVDKLSSTQPIGVRISLNLRLLGGQDNCLV